MEKNMKRSLLLLLLLFTVILSCKVKVKVESDEQKDQFEVVRLHTRYKMQISNDCSAGASLVMKHGKSDIKLIEFTRTKKSIGRIRT